MIFEIFCFKVPRWDDCSADATLLRNGTECRFGTLNDQQTMAVISFTGYLIYGGCFAATLSSAIASLVGKYIKFQILYFQSGKCSGVCQRFKEFKNDTEFRNVVQLILVFPIMDNMQHWLWKEKNLRICTTKLKGNFPFLIIYSYFIQSSVHVNRIMTSLNDVTHKSVLHIPQKRGKI